MGHDSRIGSAARTHGEHKRAHIILFTFSLGQRGCTCTVYYVCTYGARSVDMRKYKIALYKLLRLQRKRAT